MKTKKRNKRLAKKVFKNNKDRERVKEKDKYKEKFKFKFKDKIITNNQHSISIRRDVVIMTMTIIRIQDLNNRRIKIDRVYFYDISNI